MNAHQLHYILFSLAFRSRCLEILFRVFEQTEGLPSSISLELGEKALAYSERCPDVVSASSVPSLAQPHNKRNDIAASYRYRTLFLPLLPPLM
jgi:hypothetical protein